MVTPPSGAKPGPSSGSACTLARMDEAGGGAALRNGRAVMTSAVVLSLAAGAHSLGGGDLPPLIVLAALGAFVFLVATALARRRLRLGSLLPALAGIQAALHALLSFLSPTGTAAAGELMAFAGHSHTSVMPDAAASIAVLTTPLLTTPLLASPLLTAPMLTAPLSPGSGGSSMSVMLVAHAVATLVTAGLLVGADGAARRALHWLRSVVPVLGAPVVGPIATSPLAVPAQAPRFVPCTPGLARSRPRRGPPPRLATA